jgi:hypothetical protein
MSSTAGVGGQAVLKSTDSSDVSTSTSEIPAGWNFPPSPCWHTWYFYKTLTKMEIWKTEMFEKKTEIWKTEIWKTEIFEKTLNHFGVGDWHAGGGWDTVRVREETLSLGTRRNTMHEVFVM